jgi:catechol 2,3-dioxygenase-like lactoylglutathione lyase family enzyme
MTRLALTIVLSAALGAAAASAQTESPVVGLGPFLHIVADLDQSLAFYHDELGLEVSGPPGPHNFTDNPAVANLYGVPGKQFRAAVLKIPGSEMGIELVQWGESRSPRGKPMEGSGAVTLILRRTEGDRKTLHDPDGFPVEFERASNPGAGLMVSVKDLNNAEALFRSPLGLKPDQIRFTGSKPETESSASFPAPGQGMLRLFVRNVGALTASLKGAGFSVITTGGEPVTLPQGQRVIILRDPNNFYLQLMERP